MHPQCQSNNSMGNDDEDRQRCCNEIEDQCKGNLQKRKDFDSFLHFMMVPTKKRLIRQILSSFVLMFLLSSVVTAIGSFMIEDEEIESQVFVISWSVCLVTVTGMLCDFDGT